jgi:L-threonylcarbamoyladenylate synthase
LSSEIFPIDPDQPDPAIIAEAGRRLRAGGVVAHPSDTVYGLAAAARHEGALAHLRALKGRDAAQPFILLVDEPSRIDGLIHSLKRHALELIRAHWPGPVTLILESRPDTPGRSPDGSIALRCPAQALTRALVRECAGLMASTSANRGGERPVERGREALELFGAEPEGLAMVLETLVDAGKGALQTTASTIVDCRGDQPVVVRQGAVRITTGKEPG